MRRGRFFSLALKDDRVEQCLRSCGSEFQTWGPKQEKVRKPWVLRLYCWIFMRRIVPPGLKAAPRPLNLIMQISWSNLRRYLLFCVKTPKRCNHHFDGTRADFERYLLWTMPIWSLLVSAGTFGGFASRSKQTSKSTMQKQLYETDQRQNGHERLTIISFFNTSRMLIHY